ALGALLMAGNTMASVVAVAPSAFGGTPILNFNGLPDGIEVNGLAVAGVLFTYSLGNGQVIIDEGPGITNNIAPPNIVSVGNNTGILVVTLPALANLFGYGYAILNTVPVLNATTINLFNGVTPVGSLSYNGVPDFFFTGGFAGIFSTLPFDRAQLTFNSAAAPAFALDNIRIANVPVPEPSAMFLIATGMGVLLWRRRRTHVPRRSLQV